VSDEDILEGLLLQVLIIQRVSVVHPLKQVLEWLRLLVLRSVSIEDFVFSVNLGLH